MLRCLLVPFLIYPLALWLPLADDSLSAAEPVVETARPPASAAEFRYWLENMLQHGFEREEMTEALGLTTEQIGEAIERFGLSDVSVISGDLQVLPYPGGRHPRIGFLEGAIHPQRETKCSVFAPWPSGGYAVVDVPEAIWFQPAGVRKLLYLAHTHVPTVWTEQSIDLKPLEWQRLDGGILRIERRLPNQVAFGARVQSADEGVRMELWIRNGSAETLSALRVQNCVMLKALTGFAAPTNENKHFESPFAACRHATEDRWIITAWERCERPWANERCPCLHADPQFEDCPPGETRRLRGWLSFYEGADLDAELKRLRDLSIP